MLSTGLVGRRLLEEHTCGLITSLVDQLHLGAVGALVTDEVTQVVDTTEDAETRHTLIEIRDA